MSNLLAVTQAVRQRSQDSLLGPSEHKVCILTTVLNYPAGGPRQVTSSV